MNKLRWISGLLFAVVVAVFTPGCEEEDCAYEQESCLPEYLEANGLKGCCSGLTCQENPFTKNSICK